MIAALLTGVYWSQLALLAAQPLPNPNLGPDEVIRTVVEALQHHDSPTPNAGVFVVYQFASPANRQNTSPYGKFLRLVKLPAFAPLLAHGDIAYTPLSTFGDRAQQDITIHSNRGPDVRFRFLVSRQTSQQTQGRCTGCWMVDQVVPLR